MLPCRLVASIRALLFCAPLAALGGCGLGEYEALMAASLADYRELSRFQRLYGPTTLKSANGEQEFPITIRLPRRFGTNDSFTPESAYRNTGEAPPRNRLYPPFLGDFPGLVRMGEAFLKQEDYRRLSFYYYVGVLETRSVDLPKLLEALRAQMLRQRLETSDWRDVEVFDEQLATVTWKFIEAKGPQPFDNARGNDTEAALKMLPGTFHLYVREDQGYVILWAVRIPDAISGEVFLLNVAKAVAGSVKVTAPAPTGPAPKAKTPVFKPADQQAAEPDAMPPMDEAAPEDPPGATTGDGDLPAKDAAMPEPSSEEPAAEPAEEPASETSDAPGE